MTRQGSYKAISEVPFRPKINCPECRELLPESKIASHIERHRPVTTKRLGTSPCPKGCPRYLTKSELKEHVKLCDGSLPLPSKETIGPQPLVIPDPSMKEKPVPTNKVKCKICGEIVKNSKALGGHMSGHSNRKRKAARETAGKAGKRAKTPFRAIGRLLARNRSRLDGGAGGTLPLPPAPKAGTIPVLILQLQALAKRKRTEAELLEKMTQQLRELL